MTAHAFVDESERGKLYLVSAALVDPADLVRLRRALKACLLPNQRELHFKKEDSRRKRQLIDRVVNAGVQVRIYIATRRDTVEATRQICIARLARDLIALGTRRLVLDTREEQDSIDARTLRNALGPRPSSGEFTYEHLDSASEPLLWIPDAAGWCYGAGGDFKRRVTSAVTVIDCNSQ